VTDRDRLLLILQGGVPDRPPHFEIDFQLGKEMFGLDAEAAEAKTYASESARADALLKLHIELQLRLVEELGYASAFFSHEHPPERGVGKRYIFSTSNCIFQGMPPESYRIMLDEYQRLSAASSHESSTQNNLHR